MIRIEGLVKRYGAVTAVDGLSFEVERGETFALIGPNGAGKTTTLKVLLGLARPDAGSVRIGPAGLVPSDPAARIALGYVPQRVEFPPGRTVREVLGFFADLRGLDAAAVDGALGRVGLAALSARRACELSGGYTQRLSLAQALLGDPALLVMDEPTASLDPEATWEFRTLIEQLRLEGKTILLCSHLLSEVERVADRVLILVAGRRAALERLADLRVRQARASRLRVRLTHPDRRAEPALERSGLSFEVGDEHTLVVEGSNGSSLAALEALRGAGVDVRSFEVLRPTLEDLFLETVRGGKRDVV
ncbi:MAG: ABC transporter ATP-binding protein [Candidatus Eisenbacteria bacterium]